MAKEQAIERPVCSKKKVKDKLAFQKRGQSGSLQPFILLLQVQAKTYTSKRKYDRRDRLFRILTLSFYFPLSKQKDSSYLSTNSSPLLSRDYGRAVHQIKLKNPKWILPPRLNLIIFLYPHYLIPQHKATNDRHALDHLHKQYKLPSIDYNVH